MAQTKKTAGRRKAAKKASLKTAKPQTMRTENTTASAAKKAPAYSFSNPLFQSNPASMMDGVQKTMSMFYKPQPHTMETMMTQGKTKFDKISHEAADLGRDHVEAMIKTGSLFAKGFEEILRTSMSLAQDSAEKQAQFIKQAMSVKTLNEWTDVHNRIAQANFDDFMAGATKISELSVKLLTQSTEPLNNQINKTVQKATQSMAA
jgi:phasin family protein